MFQGFKRIFFLFINERYTSEEKYFDICAIGAFFVFFESRFEKFKNAVNNKSSLQKQYNALENSLARVSENRIKKFNRNYFI